LGGPTSLIGRQAQIAAGKEKYLIWMKGDFIGIYRICVVFHGFSPKKTPLRLFWPKFSY
jgi:hypothetical protein